MLDVSLTVTSMPVHVWRVKLDVVVLSMMPVPPPSAGPLTGEPPVGLGDGVGVAAAVAEAEDVDGDEVAAAAAPDPATTTAADASPAPTIQALLFFGENRRVRGRRLSADADPGPDAAGEWLVESWPFMMKLLSFRNKT
jgi:hypothetical protein